MAVAPTLNDIRVIAPILEDKLKLDIYNFALSFLRRRFAYVFKQLNIKNVSYFIDEIKKGNLVSDFLYHFNVSDTEMFRDPSFWRTLRNKLLPLFNGSNINIWLPEVVSIHELFSLLVILREVDLLESVNIYCNSPSKNIIKEIQDGKVPLKTIEVSKQNFKRLELHSHFEDYFLEEDNTITINKEFLKNVIFINNSYFNEGPGNEIDITLFRNRMIYYNSKLQTKAENEIFKYIKKGGFLALGIRENISKTNSMLLETHDKNEQIFKV
ncbi:CheR family methyltransferase [Plebeiibacterium marinum]|uniref:CheR-type methyltransferase domain-containing protein n=1 Tax=Plebeiibacterium marinum TaxID=2992111 RepID=A0AAE3MF38_9BACT|nr:CheR family methyltransferase [Plebeiobacterium marinum]MCW3806421.1 hypothetical protein [Plebeiobacterium marinum]